MSRKQALRTDRKQVLHTNSRSKSAQVDKPAHKLARTQVRKRAGSRALVRSKARVRSSKAQVRSKVSQRSRPW